MAGEEKKERNATGCAGFSRGDLGGRPLREERGGGLMGSHQGGNRTRRTLGEHASRSGVTSGRGEKSEKRGGGGRK